MSRYIRNTVAQCKIEATYGVNPGSFAATDAILVSEASISLSNDNVPRNLIRGFLGASEELAGAKRAEIDLTVELASSGALGTAPAMGPLLKACGLQETITATTRVEYLPRTTGFESVTLRYALDGVIHTVRGCRGTVTIDLATYQIPSFKFKLSGIDFVTAAAAVPATDYTAWRRPQVASAGALSEVRLGSTYTTGTIAGGTLLSGTEMVSVDLGNDLEHIQLLGDEAVDITDRKTSGKIKVFLSAADEVTWRTAVNDNTLSSLSVQHGTGVGNVVGIHMPSVQRVSPQEAELNGRAMLDVGLRVLPVNGNDELRLVFK